eukprot:3015407-Prorocentrum_lima.AAC.1
MLLQVNQLPEGQGGDSTPIPQQPAGAIKVLPPGLQQGNSQHDPHGPGAAPHMFTARQDTPPPWQ